MLNDYIIFNLNLDTKYRVDLQGVDLFIFYVQSMERNVIQK